MATWIGNTSNNITVNAISGISGIAPYGPGTSNSATWTSTAGGYTINPTTHSTKIHINENGISMAEGTDLMMGATSLKDTLAGIESRLAMLKPSPEIEAEWEELKRLGDEYRALEKEIQDKMKSWDILKK